MAPDTGTLLAGLLPFEHAPYFDFARPEVAQAQRDAFALVRREHVGQSFPLLIGGQEAQGTGTFGVTNPGDTRETVWHFQNAAPEQLGQRPCEISTMACRSTRFTRHPFWPLVP